MAARVADVGGVGIVGLQVPERVGARGDGLHLQRLDRPAVGHLIGDDAVEVCFKKHRVDQAQVARAGWPGERHVAGVVPPAVAGVVDVQIVVGRAVGILHERGGCAQCYVHGARAVVVGQYHAGRAGRLHRIGDAGVEVHAGGFGDAVGSLDDECDGGRAAHGGEKHLDVAVVGDRRADDREH